MCDLRRMWANVLVYSVSSWPVSRCKLFNCLQMCMIRLWDASNRQFTDILQELASVIDDSNMPSRFNITRRNIWDGARRALMRPTYCPASRISVKFTDDVGTAEGVVDEGGPCRELLQLLTTFIYKDSRMFLGSSSSKHLNLVNDGLFTPVMMKLPMAVVYINSAAVCRVIDILSLHFVVSCIWLVLMHHGQVAVNISEYFKRTTRNYWRSHNLAYQVPVASVDCIKFYVFPRTACNWNMLPFDVVIAPSLNSFRARLRREEPDRTDY